MIPPRNHRYKLLHAAERFDRRKNTNSKQHIRYTVYCIDLPRQVQWDDLLRNKYCTPMYAWGIGILCVEPPSHIGQAPNTRKGKIKSGLQPTGTSETEGGRCRCMLVAEPEISGSTQRSSDCKALPMVLHLTLLFAL